MEKLFKKLSKIPESLLVFPLLKIIQFVCDETKELTTCPKLPFTDKDGKQNWESECIQRYDGNNWHYGNENTLLLLKLYVQIS